MSNAPSQPDMLEKWRSGLPHETEFWRKQVESGDSRWTGEMERRLQDRELHPNFQEAIGAPEGAVVRILDVGSGPLSVLGNLWPGRRVVIHPTDPLADEYNAMLDRAGYAPRFRPIRCDGEQLVEKFGENFFDMAFCHNALDHCYDPVAVIEQMLSVVKPGMTVRLEHVQNEGVREDYVGLHQWNLAAEPDGATGVQQFVVWNPTTRVNVTERLHGAARVMVYSAGEWLSVVILKRG
jgi:SAM-dependent methyltransferase